MAKKTNLNNPETPLLGVDDKSKPLRNSWEFSPGPCSTVRPHRRSTVWPHRRWLSPAFRVRPNARRRGGTEGQCHQTLESKTRVVKPPTTFLSLISKPVFQQVGNGLLKILRSLTLVIPKPKHFFFWMLNFFWMHAFGSKRAATNDGYFFKSNFEIP